MKFVEVIESLNYKLIEKEENKIVIEKETDLSVSNIIFNMELKYINFVLQPKKNIHNQEDFDCLSNDWNLLKKDLETFKGLSKYRII